MNLVLTKNFAEKIQKWSLADLMNEYGEVCKWLAHVPTDHLSETPRHDDVDKIGDALMAEVRRREALYGQPPRDHPRSCSAGSFGTSIMLRDGTKVCLVRGEGAESAHVWLEVRDAEVVDATKP